MSAEHERDKGLQQVWREAWQRAALERVVRLPPGWEGTGEDIRLHVLGTGLVLPHDPHAWGALINNCQIKGVLEKTGERRKMKTKTSHARSTDVLRRVWPTTPHGD